MSIVLKKYCTAKFSCTSKSIVVYSKIYFRVVLLNIEHLKEKQLKSNIVEM